MPYVWPLRGFPSTEVRLYRDFPDVFAAEYAERSKRFAQQLQIGDPFQCDLNRHGHVASLLSAIKVA